MPLWPLMKEVMDFVAQCIFDGQTMLTWILRTQVFLLVFFQQMCSWKLHIALTTPADALVHHLQSHSFVKGNLVQAISRKKTFFETEDFIKSASLLWVLPKWYSGRILPFWQSEFPFEVGDSSRKCALTYPDKGSDIQRPPKKLKKNLTIQLFVKTWMEYHFQVEKWPSFRAISQVKSPFYVRASSHIRNSRNCHHNFELTIDIIWSDGVFIQSWCWRYGSE